MRPNLRALATKSFSTKSRRSLGLAPQAVANLKHFILKLSSSRPLREFSTLIFDFAYAVNGLTSSFSVLSLSPAAPYTLQLDANTKFLTPHFYLKFGQNF